MAVKKKKKQSKYVESVLNGTYEWELPSVKFTNSNDKKAALENEIAPTRKIVNTTPKARNPQYLISKSKSSSSNKKNKKDTWISKGAFDDGYQLGDITKSILGTAGDVATGVTKGLVGLGEGIGDTINYGVAGVADLVGADKWADKYRKEVSKSVTDQLFKPAEDFFDKFSVIGERGDNISQGLGNVAGIIATGGLGASAGLGAVGTTALTTGVTGMSSTGFGMSEAYQSGATDEEALTYGLISGVAEAGTELLFGGLGKGVNALGLSKGALSLDDALAKKVTSKISSQLAKNLTQYGIKAGAEGFEEVASGFIQALGKKATYMSEEELGKIIEDEQLLDQFIMGAITSGVAQSGIVPGMRQGSLIETTKQGKDFITGYTQNEQKVVDSLVEEQSNELSKQKAIENAINEAITTRETEQQGILSSKEKTALTEGIKAKIEAGELDVSNTKLTNKEISKIRQEVENNLQQGLLDTNKIDSILGNTITENDSLLARSYQETAKRSQNFTYDSSKVTNEQEKAVYDSAAKYFNDTTRSHEFVEKVAKISKDKGTNYGFINNEELQALGHDVEGKQVNGLVRTSQDGKQTVLINVDSPKALNTIVGHETTHLLENTQEYKELQEAIFNYAKEKGDFDSRQKTLTSLYEGIENANIDSELTADLVGDYLFTDSKFIDSLSTQKPTVFQKIKDLIDDLVIKFKGTKEEKQLREVQKKFKEAYKQNVASKETNTQYAISDNTELYNKIKNEKQLVSLTNKLSDILDSGKMDHTKTSVQVQNLGSRYVGYGQQAIKFKPEILDYIDQMYKGDGSTRHEFSKERTDKFNSLEELINDNPKFYNEITFKEDLPLELIEEVTIPKNSSTELIEKLTNAGIKINYYNAAPSYNTTKDVQYSLTDNQGRKLTKEQQEYFKDSKVRDEEGRLLEVYHGSPNKFTVFDGEKISDGLGFFFSDRSLNNYYGNEKSFYLNVENMLVVHQGEEYVTNLLDIAKNDVGRRTKLQEQGYDGIAIVYTSSDGSKITDYVVFNSNQIKNVDNTNPTSDADIRYSLSEDNSKVQRAKEYFGVTTDLREAGYLTIDGEYIDLSGKNQGGTPGTRTLDHRDIGDIYTDEEYDLAENKYPSMGTSTAMMQAFIDEGNIRLIPGQGVDISTEPTKAQYDKLYNYLSYIQTVNGDVLIDLETETKNRENLEYNDRTSISKMISDIKNHYAKYSLSQQGEQIAPTGNYNVYGEDVKLQETIAPLQEEIKTLTESVQELKEQLAPIKEQRDEFAPITEADLPMLEQQYEEDFKNIDESNMPMETEDTTPDNETEMTSSKSLFETRNYEELGNRKINAYQYDHPEAKPYFQEEAKSMLGDLKNSIKGERFYNDDLYYASNGEQGYFGTERQTTDDIAELLDGLDGKYKLTYADIEKGLNAIINDEGAENNVASKRIEMYLDQRLRKGYTTVDGFEVPANQEYINMMDAKDITDYYNNLPIDESMIPYDVSNSENIAPVKEQKTEKVKEEYLAITPEKEPKLIKVKDEPTYNEIAEVLDKEPVTENDRNKRKWAIFKANVFDKGMVFEDLALKEKNREIISKWDYTLTSEARGQNVIGQGHYEFDPYTRTKKQTSKSLNDIQEEVGSTGLTKEFYEYMYHKHNVDRMTLDKRFGMENKPVFGNVTAEQSQVIVNEYEAEYPEFMEFAQDVYDYVNADKKQLVENGVISQETSDLWSKMYPHYVPTRRTTDIGLDINVPLDTKRTGINAPVKQATGGSADILPLFDTMAMRTLQTYRATAKNSFGVELMDALGTKIEKAPTSVDEVIDSIEAQEDLLQEGKKGRNPTFTVFENGEKVTFEITKDMYDALKPLDESSPLSKTIKPLNIAKNIHRGVLTEYNPIFMLTNAAKDVQDVLINSQHATRTYLTIPEAFKQLTTKGYWYQEYIANGGEQNSYFDNQTNTFKTNNKGLSRILDIPPLSTISKLNNYIEMIPRLSEYIASRKIGRSVETSMLDAARVTTNFKAGGNLTKFLDRNGASFLNASVNGAMQQVRNVREAKANGIRGWANLATKFAIAGLPAYLLNNLLWDDDEEYEELSDYVKQNYYVVAKDDNGNFIRIPKGRTLAVIQEGLKLHNDLVTGNDEADLKSFIDLLLNNLAPNNPIENNIFSPITQVATNKAWYGGDLVPTRLQNLPKKEQYDESTDMFSRWVGETFNVSPYKVNYLLDQYSGGVGDMVLPMLTPEAESDGDTVQDYLIAPIKDKFTTNSTLNNQNVSDFYDLKEEYTIKANKTKATDTDILQNKYLNSVNAELSELYEEKRNIQNSDLSNSEKYKQAMEIQEQINEITENALSDYTKVSTASNYAQVGNREYFKKENSDGEEVWYKINDEETEDLKNLGLNKAEKNTYFSIKNQISSIKSDDNDYQERKNQIINIVRNSGFNDEQKAYMYKKYYNTDTVDTIVSAGIDIDCYFDYAMQDIKADKDKQGNSIPYSRKNKVVKYINSLSLSIPEKAILIKATNTFKFNKYNKQIINYVNELDIPYSEKVSILEELDMEVLSDGTIKWE